jgi:hypothetical protein
VICFGIQRLSGQEQQGIDLPHRAVDAPAAAHLSEMQDELLLEGCECHGPDILFAQRFQKLLKLR